MPFNGCTSSASYTRARYRTLIVSAFYLACSFASIFVARANAAQAAASAVQPKPSYTRAHAPAPTGDVTALLSSSQDDTRASAVQAVIDHRANASADALTAASRGEKNPEIRLRMLMAAFDVNRSSAEPFLIAALGGDKSPMVRAVSAQILIRAVPDDAIRLAFLNGLANDKDLDVRRSCASGLGYHRSPDAVTALTAAASDRDPEMRRRAGLALLQQPKSAATDLVLGRLENDSDKTVAALIHSRRQVKRSAP
jgi:HEAT repeat protein